jgi:hypothetical protein
MEIFSPFFDMHFFSIHGELAMKLNKNENAHKKSRGHSTVGNIEPQQGRHLQGAHRCHRRLF